VAGRAVGKAGVPFVEKDQPAHGGQPPEEGRSGRILPSEFDVADQARHEQDVGRSLADDLIGDVHTTAVHVASLGHGGLVTPWTSGRAGQERRVLPQDLGLQLAQLRAGLDPELIDQGGA
jgi:hypothetical protein